MSTAVATTGATPLSAPERERLAELEGIIERGFVEWGAALAEIRDSEPKLYRATHPTFEAYCRERWSMRRAHAYRLIGAAAVVGRLSPIGDKPENEAQVRPLTRIPAAQQPAAWERAVDIAEEEHGEGSRPTARIVERAVEELNPAPELPKHLRASTPATRRLFKEVRQIARRLARCAASAPQGQYRELLRAHSHGLAKATQAEEESYASH